MNLVWKILNQPQMESIGFQLYLFPQLYLNQMNSGFTSEFMSSYCTLRFVYLPNYSLFELALQGL